MIAKIKIGKHRPGDYCQYLCDESPDKSHLLRVISIGYGPERLTPKRVLVRNFYVLHFVMDGNGHYNGTRFGPGDVLLSTPLVPEIREFPPGVHLTCAWIRFEGEAVAELLSRSGISPQTQVLSLSKSAEAVAIIKDTIHTPHEESTLGYTLLGAFFRILALFPRTGFSMPNKDTPTDKAVQYIKGNYNRSLSVAEIAKQANVSAGHLTRLFRQTFSLSVMDYMTSYRLECACLLLRDTALKVYEVSNAVGFRDARYFSHVFTQKMGVAPLQYRKNQATANE